jgi:hypothetical protein
VERRGVAVVVVLCFVLWPPLVLASLWKLGAFSPLELDAWHGAVSAAVLFAGVIVPRAAARELRGVLGVEIDDDAIATRRARIAWADVTGVEEPRWGTLVVRADARSVTVQTYLFRDRDALRSFVLGRGPTPAPDPPAPTTG